MQGAGQSIAGGIVEVVDARTLEPGRRDPELQQYLEPEPLIESDDPQIRDEAERAVAGTRAIARVRSG